MNKQKKSKIIYPFIIVSCLLAFGFTLYLTDIFSPLMQYIHDYRITPLGALGCLVATIFAFWAVYKILAKLGESFLPTEGEQDED